MPLDSAIAVYNSRNNIFLSRAGSSGTVGAGAALWSNKAIGVGMRCNNATCGGGGVAVYDTSALRLLAGCRLTLNRHVHPEFRAARRCLVNFIHGCIYRFSKSKQLDFQLQ